MAEVPAKRKRLTAGARREMIAQAALRLFAEHGYERTTTREIAREAGVSEGTIYCYFPTKRDLLFAFFTDEVFAPLTAIFTRTPSDDDFTIIRAFIADRFALWQRHRPLMKVLIAEALFHEEIAARLDAMLEPPRRLIEAYVRRRVADGAFRPVDAGVAVRALLVYTLGYFVRWVLSGPPAGAEMSDALIDELTRLYLHGITVPLEPNDA